jgi:sodium/bile acid cotransporter 7
MVSLLIHANGTVTLGSIEAIIVQILVPFSAGQLLHSRLGAWAKRNKPILAIVDRGSILMVVYGAFSEAVSRGLWNQLPLESLAVMAVLNFVLLGIVLGLTDRFGRAVGFNAEDRITLIFCGSKKSLASGVPMANILFPAAMVGPVVLPLMLFHQIQLMACAYLARRFAGRAAPAEAADERHPPLAA